MTTGGFFLPTDGPMNAFWALWTSRIGNKRVMPPIARSTKEDVLLLKELIEAGKYRVVIDRTYPFEDVVEAARYVDTAQKTGNVVLTVAANPNTAARSR
jgi:NADPH:quinone reductase-like Zn-dependent oxidoreductase